jgi:hypothetical protein
MRWPFIIVNCFPAGLGQRPDPLYQGLTQMLEFGDLRLLIR